MYANATNLDTIKYAMDSPDYSNYLSARYHDDMAGGISHYIKNFADSVVSYGFVFTAGGNTVKMMHDVDPEKVLMLPLNLNDTFTDSTYGHADVGGTVSTTAGDIVVVADGTGTLNLGTSTFSNVIRVKMVESIETSITVPIPLTGTVTRTTYTYYDFGVQNEPLFIHSTIFVDANVFTDSYTACYSSVPLTVLGIEDEELSSLGIYPNPATDLVTITSENIDQLVVLNSLGEVVATYSKPQNKMQLDVSNYDNGVYFVQIKRGDATKTEKLIVK